MLPLRYTFNKLKLNSMRKLSFWAKQHPWYARIIIVISFLLLGTIGILSGLMLGNLGVSLPLAFLLCFAAVYAFAFIAYPRKKEKGMAFYRKQKACDLLLAASTFFMILYLGNHPEQVFRYQVPFTSAMAIIPVNPGDSMQRSFKPISVFAKSMKGEDGKLLKWKERKKMLKSQIKTIKTTEGLSRSSQTGLIILSVIVALGLLYLVGALACTLSCNGSQVAAVIVGVGGAALIIFLLFIVIRNLTGKKKKEIKNPDNEPPAN